MRIETDEANAANRTTGARGYIDGIPDARTNASCPFMPLNHERKMRMDCSSSYAVANPMKLGLPRRAPKAVGPFLLAILLGAVWAGCRSPQGASSPYLAAVVVEKKTVAQVEAATRAFFEEQGYQGVLIKPGQFKFDKPGTGMNTLVYGDWSGKKVWVRVKVSVDEMRPEQQVRLACDAFMVGEHGDARFEEEHKLTRVHRGKYQAMLEEVSRRLK